MISFTLADIAQVLGLELVGDDAVVVTKIASLNSADAASVSFIAQNKFLTNLADTQASAVILSADLQDQFSGNKLISTDPYLSFAKLSALFDLRPVYCQGIHPSAVIDSTAEIATTASIGPNVVIGSFVKIGERSQISANCVIADFVQIGDDAYFMPNVSIYHRVRMGHHVTIHSNTAIGCDGFGFAPNPHSDTESKWQKIHQLGAVIIGNYVEIGSATTIDRGTLEDTIIHDGVIIDNQVHIAHNCSIGKNTALAAAVIMAGSTHIGEGCTFGGGVGIAGHLSIADDCHFTGMTMVTSSIKKSGTYSSGTGYFTTSHWRKCAVRFGQLNTMNKRVCSIEKALAKKNE